MQLEAGVAVRRRLDYVDLYEKRVSRVVDATILDPFRRAIAIDSDYATRPHLDLLLRLCRLGGRDNGQRHDDREQDEWSQHPHFTWLQNWQSLYQPCIDLQDQQRIEAVQATVQIPVSAERVEIDYKNLYQSVELLTTRPLCLLKHVKGI